MSRSSISLLIAMMLALSPPPSFAAFAFWKTNAATAYRYYRVVVTSINDNSGLSILYDAELYWGGAWQTDAMTDYTVGTVGGLSATISESSTYSGAGWKAYDGNCSNNWNTGAFTFDSSAPYNSLGLEWVKIDFGSGVTHAVTGLRVKSPNVDAFYLEGSNDNSAWTTITGSSWTGSPGYCASWNTVTW